MLAYLAAALLAPIPSPVTAAPASETPPLESAAPWWEKITVIVDDKGAQQSCRYETSAAGARACDKAMADSISAGGGRNRSGVFSKLIYERRFVPGGRPDAAKLQPGDTLLGRQVMYLTFDAAGAVSSCKVVATAGDTPPAYDCNDAKKEQFRPEASAAKSRQAFMTISAYGHMETVA